MNVQCPYNKTALLIASISCSNKLEKLNKEKGEEWVAAQIDAVTKELPTAPNDRAMLNVAVAMHHGIVAETLINSPNYDKLVDTYFTDLVNRLVLRLQASLGLETAETWALLLHDQLG